MLVRKALPPGTSSCLFGEYLLTPLSLSLSPPFCLCCLPPSSCSLPCSGAVAWRVPLSPALCCLCFVWSSGPGPSLPGEISGSAELLPVDKHWSWDCSHGLGLGGPGFNPFLGWQCGHHCDQPGDTLGQQRGTARGGHTAAWLGLRGWETERSGTEGWTWESGDGSGMFLMDQGWPWESGDGSGMALEKW